MDSGYYAACAGLAAQSQALELVAHNLANLGTSGSLNRPRSTGICPRALAHTPSAKGAAVVRNRRRSIAFELDLTISLLLGTRAPPPARRGKRARLSIVDESSRCSRFALNCGRGRPRSQ